MEHSRVERAMHHWLVAAAIGDAAATTRKLETQLAGAVEMLQATDYAQTIRAEINALEQTTIKLRERAERLERAVERAYQQHEAREALRAAGAVADTEPEPELDTELDTE